MSGFGDARIDNRFEWLLDRVVASGSVVLRQLGQTRAGELAAHRFLDNGHVTPAGILEPVMQRTAIACTGRRIVAVQDTTEINFAGRDKRRKGLGAGGNGEARGYFVHPVIAVDRHDDAVLGLIDAQIWTRGDEALSPHKTRAFADRESWRWLEGARRSKASLEGASQIVMVADREADIYALFAQCPEGVDMVIRSARNRVLADGSRLQDVAAALPDCGQMDVAVSARPGQKARIAKIQLKAGLITLRRPKHGSDRCDPVTLPLTLVSSLELAPPQGCKPLNWRICTTLPVHSEADARDIIEIYKQRWRIEEVFRALKSGGLNIEDSQVESAHRLFNLTAVAMVAATRIIQLVDARDTSLRPATDVMDKALITPTIQIGKTLEGKTQRQKNHHAEGSLPWLSWIVARLGGWNCYYKPPGPKTMALGWNTLANMLAGFLLAQDLEDV